MPRFKPTRFLAALVTAVVAVTTISVPAEAVPQGAALASVQQQQDLRQECLQRPEAETARGWIKSRFESCHHKKHEIVLTKKGFPQERLGTLIFDEWILGFAYDGSRRVDYVASIEDILVAADAGQDATTWSISMGFSNSVSGGGTVIRPGRETRDELLGGWDTTPQWMLTYTSPEENAPAPYGIVNANTIVSLSVDAPGTDGWYDDVARYSNTRFDSAGAVAGKHRGTVFTQARVVVPFSTNPNTGFPESTRHYNDALTRPVTTFPSIIGKNVPGVDTPLHRTLDSSLQTANTARAVKTCKDVWGPYDGSLLNCDEFPFASTREGAANANGHYSARLIDAADNQASGRWLNSYYTANRILDGDPFYIAIT